MAACDVGCAADKPDEVKAASDRVEYKANVDDAKEDVKEEIPEVVQMFGDELLSKDGNISTKELMKKDVIGIYFSAHWCPPCRNFTPRLAEAYNNLQKEEKSIEIVFVSSDKTEADFQGYYKEMPWLALPFALRDQKRKLSQKFEVRGIPRLLLLDPKTGKVTNPRANQDVVSDKAGEKFPWFNPLAGTILGNLIDAKVNLKTGDEAAVRDIGRKYLAFLFHDKTEASKAFLQTMVNWYNKFQPKLEDTDRSFEVVFISSDEDEQAYEESFKDMPWAALSFKEKAKRNELSQRARAPVVFVVEAKTGKFITAKGTNEVEEEKEDDTDFPWPRPKPCSDMNEDPQVLNDYPTFVVWLEEKSKEKQAEDVKMLTTLAKANVASNGDRQFGFLYVLQKGTNSSKLRDIIKQPDNKNAYTLIDFGSQRKYNSDNLSADELNSVMGKFKDSSLEMEIFALV